MESRQSLTGPEFLDKLKDMKTTFHNHGDAEGLLRSLISLLDCGLIDSLDEEGVATSFGDVFLGLEVRRRMEARFALISAIRETSAMKDRRSVGNKIARAIISHHPKIRTDAGLRVFVRQVSGIRGSIDKYIENPKLIPV